MRSQFSRQGTKLKDNNSFAMTSRPETGRLKTRVSGGEDDIHEDHSGDESFAQLKGGGIMMTTKLDQQYEDRIHSERSFYNAV